MNRDSNRLWRGHGVLAALLALSLTAAWSPAAFLHCAQTSAASVQSAQAAPVSKESKESKESKKKSTSRFTLPLTSIEAPAPLTLSSYENTHAQPLTFFGIEYSEASQLPRYFASDASPPPPALLYIARPAQALLTSQPSQAPPNA